jgi:chitodextrinase
MSVRPAWPLSAGLILLIALAVVVPSAATGASAKGTLRTTGKTTTTVSLAWNSFGNSNYVVSAWIEGKFVNVELPRTQTSYTWTGLLPNGQYFFVVKSGSSSTNLLQVTTERDVTPPAAPGNLTVGTVTAPQISLTWEASADDSGIREYLLSVSPHSGNVIKTGPTSVNVVGLAPLTEYTFTVKARDLGWNLSPSSNAVSATTAASTDTTPPTAPTNLDVDNVDWCGEVEVEWTQSTDDQDPQSAIRYRIFINGTLDFTAIGTRRAITYGIVDGENTFVLRAVDSAGNVSAPSNSVTLHVPIC